MGRSHRTALVIDYSDPSEPPDYRERVGRLLESLNGVNIKVDVYSYYGPAESKPTGLVAGPPKGLSSYSPPSASFEQEVHNVAVQGYSQVLVNRPARAF